MRGHQIKSSSDPGNTLVIGILRMLHLRLSSACIALHISEGSRMYGIGTWPFRQAETIMRTERTGMLYITDDNNNQ